MARGGHWKIFLPFITSRLAEPKINNTWFHCWNSRRFIHDILRNFERCCSFMVRCVNRRQVSSFLNVDGFGEVNGRDSDDFWPRYLGRLGLHAGGAFFRDTEFMKKNGKKIGKIFFVVEKTQFQVYFKFNFFSSTFPSNSVHSEWSALWEP